MRWTSAGQRHVHATEDGTAFVRELFARLGDDVSELEVTHTTLEDTYLAMVARSDARRRETELAPPQPEAAR